MEQMAIRLAAGSGATFGVDDLACAAATDLGIWAEEGLDVAWTPVHGGVAAIEALLSGRVDVAYGGLGAAVAARAKGAPVRIVVSMARSLAQNLVARHSIADPAALRGASWAIDGHGALSHQMARLIVRALGISESEIDWRVLGPPPQRIEALLAGDVAASLVRVEEAMMLGEAHADQLRVLLGYGDLRRLVAVQPHGVLSTTEACERDRPEALARLVRGMIRASRTLHADLAAFESVYRRNVTVALPEGDVAAIWRQERDGGGFAVNGEMSRHHWERQLATFRELEPGLPAVAEDELLARRFVAGAIGRLGAFDAPFDRPET